MIEKNTNSMSLANSPTHIRPNLLAVSVWITLYVCGSLTAHDAHAFDNRAVVPTAGIQVTNCSDHDAGSLRAAIATAQAGDTIDARGVSCSTINLESYIFFMQGGAGITILGSSSSALTIRADQTPATLNRRIFIGYHTPLRLQGVTLRGGLVKSSSATLGAPIGGCIQSDDKIFLGDLAVGPNSGVVLDDCHVVSTQGSAQSTAAGGAIFTTSAVSMAYSTIQGSSAQSLGSQPTISIGGGLFAGSLNMTHSTISGNAAIGATPYDCGGGANVHGNSILIASSTISGNSASKGAGICIGGIGAEVVANLPYGSTSSAIVRSTTITDNTGNGNPAAGAGLFAYNAVVDLQSVIISGNSIGATSEDSNGVSVSFTGSKNLIGHPSGFGVPADTLIGVDPKLGSLANNGGPTSTHSLLSGSPAIDAGNNAGAETYDQRGFGHARVLGAGVDIGSFERNSDEIFANGFD